MRNVRAGRARQHVDALRVYVILFVYLIIVVIVRVAPAGEGPAEAVAEQ